MNPINVAIADDHQLFRRGVIHSLQSAAEIRFVAEADNGQALLEQLRLHTVQVVLTDLKMPGKDGMETTKIISREFPDIKILVLSMHEDERFIYHLMEQGAHGYLFKNAEPREIKKAILEVMEKGYYLNEAVHKILLKQSSLKTRPAPSLSVDLNLNEREKMVLQLICMEFTAAEIAQKMELSSRTVESIKDRLMDRFAVKNTAGLVFFAVKNNLVD